MVEISAMDVVKTVLLEGPLVFGVFNLELAIRGHPFSLIY